MKDINYEVDYKEGTKAIDEPEQVKKLIRSKGDFELWTAGGFGAIVKTGETPRFERRLAGILVYDWNALTGDNLKDLEDMSKENK